MFSFSLGGPRRQILGLMLFVTGGKRKGQAGMNLCTQVAWAR